MNKRFHFSFAVGATVLIAAFEGGRLTAAVLASSSPVVNAIAPHPSTGWSVFSDEETTLPAGMTAHISIRTPEEIERVSPGAYAYQTYDSDGSCLLVFPPTVVEYDADRGYARFKNGDDHDSVAHELAHCALGDWHGDVVLRYALHPRREPLQFPRFYAAFDSWLWQYQWNVEYNRALRSWEVLR